MNELLQRVFFIDKIIYLRPMTTKRQTLIEIIYFRTVLGAGIPWGNVLTVRRRNGGSL